MTPECGTEGTLWGVAGSPAKTLGTRCLCLQRALPRMPEASSVPVGILRAGPGVQARARGPAGGGCDWSFGLLAEDPSRGHLGPWTVLNL